jgi:endonuclease I
MEKKLQLLGVVCLMSLLALAQEPAANPTNLQFNTVKAYSFNLQFTPSTADGFLVVKSDKPITFSPVDGTTYEKGQGVGGVKVVSTGAFSSVYVREVVENTLYNIAVFAYNGTGAAINYKQSAPLTGSVTSMGFNQDAYFASIDSSAGTFINDLHNVISPHTMATYSPGYKTLILPVIYERDTVAGKMVVNCEYSGVTTTYVPPFDFTAQAYNREHALPKSWMLTGGNTNNPDGADYHNLLLTRDVPNQTRSNHPLGIVVNVTSTFGGSKYGTDSNGNPVFEPQDSRKGDAARNMFYQMICYNGNGGIWGLDYLLTEATNQDQNVLKLWNTQDPPDKFERTKDEYIYSVQNNRNPFIAYPGWANCINWDSLVKTNLCGTISGMYNPTLNADVKLYPNPSDSHVTIDIVTGEKGSLEIELRDITGRPVYQQVEDMQSVAAHILLPLSGLSAGNYIVSLKMNGRTMYNKLVIQ